MKVKPVNGIADPGRQITAHERRRMIAEAAYFRALSREFQGGDALDDWYGAEREIDQALLSVEAQGRSREKALVVRETRSVDAAKPGARQ